MAEIKKLVINDVELKELLEEKGKSINEGRELSNKIEEMKVELQKIGYVVDKLKEKIKPLVESHKNKSGYDIYDIATNVEVSDKGEVVVDIVNVIEDFKEQYAIQYYKNPDAEEVASSDLAESGEPTEIGELEEINEEDKK